jgi:hypothetical protein
MIGASTPITTSDAMPMIGPARIIAVPGVSVFAFAFSFPPRSDDLLSNVTKTVRGNSLPRSY